MTDRRGGVTEGVTTFPNAATFMTEATRFAPNGAASEHRDDNVIVSDQVHNNETFRREDGRWISEGVYQWTRESG